MRKFVFVLLLVLAVVVPFTQAQDASNTVRAIWNNDVLVLINISGDGVDLSELALQGETGAILPENWVMAVDASTTLSYSLYNVRPGSCLIAYRSGAQPVAPETVSCTRTIGEFEVTNIDDIIWTPDRASFTPVLAGTAGAACDTRNRTACDIAVNPLNPNPPAEMGTPEETTISAIWNNDILVLLNSSEYGVNLTALSLASVNTDGAISPDLWVMGTDDAGLSYALADVRPGSCLLAYLGTAGADTPAPTLPENVTCTRTIGTFTAENPLDLVWSAESGGFVPVVAGSAGDTCAYGSTTDCAITVPVAQAGDSSTVAGGATDAPEVRLLWNTEVLVVINISSSGVDLTGLTLEAASGGGSIAPEQWTLNTDAAGVSYALADVRPGSCLLAYLGTAGSTTAAPELPENVACTRVIGQFTAESAADIVWSVDFGGFTALVNGAASATCDPSRSSCDVDLD